jgi:putative methyltransferase (TIGR04325 family)
MDERIKRAIRAVIPSRMLDPIVKRFFRIRWTGDYASWAAAALHSRGYGDASILDRVIAATRLVRDGAAAYERDGVAFAQPAVSPGLLAGLQAAVPAGGRLSVLDFGGALGSAYWQHRAWLDTLAEVRWSVVEQTHFVQVGRTEFTDNRLRFYGSIEECMAHEQPAVLLLSGVLPYLPEPHALLALASRLNFDYVLIDRTGIVDRPSDRLTVQQVPRSLYRASYPCWFFNRAQLLAHFMPRYELLHEYIADDGLDAGVVFKGFQLRRASART